MLICIVYHHWAQKKYQKHLVLVIYKVVIVVCLMFS